MAAAKGSSRGSAARTQPPSTAAIPQLSWQHIRPAPVILVSGSESFLAERAIQQLRELLKHEEPNLEVSDIDAANYAPGELLTVASPSLFGEPRLIRVSTVEKCTDDFLRETVEYLGSPADDTYLVLRHGGGVRGKRLLDAVRGGIGGGIEVVCAELKKDAERLDFVRAEFAVVDRRASSGAVRALITAFSGDLAELSSACHQLIADTSDEITEAMVDRYYGGRAETNAFAVADSAIAGHYAEALTLVRYALASGADPVPLVAAFAVKLRTMAKVFGIRESSGQLASRLGLAPWQIDRARRDLQGWTGSGLGRSIQVLAEVDESIKGTGRDSVYALEWMISIVAARGEN